VASGADPLETMPVSPHARLTRRLLWVLAVAVLAFLYLPIAFMILLSFNQPRTVGLPITGFTLDWYASALNNRLLLDALKNSIVVALAVAALASIIGTMAAFVLVRGRLRFPGVARVMATLPIMLPGFLLGLGILIFLRRILDLELSLWTVLVGHLVITVPFVILIVAARLQGFDRFLEWAAADLGADGWQTVRFVILPLTWPAILAGALISVTLSIDEFVVTFFTIGPQATLPMYIYTQVRFGVTPEVNAIATIMLVATLALLVAGYGAASLRRRFRGGVQSG
jgi:spermidine/putrescine transport system permease protein